jgi:hypothetical protein
MKWIYLLIFAITTFGSVSCSGNSNGTSGDSTMDNMTDSQATSPQTDTTYNRMDSTGTRSDSAR